MSWKDSSEIAGIRINWWIVCRFRRQTEPLGMLTKYVHSDETVERLRLSSYKTPRFMTPKSGNAIRLVFPKNHRSRLKCSRWIL